MHHAGHIFIQQRLHVSAEIKFLTKPLGPNMHMMSNLTINSMSGHHMFCIIDMDRAAAATAPAAQSPTLEPDLLAV
jgi:hypothetical protein